MIQHGFFLSASPWFLYYWNTQKKNNSLVNYCVNTQCNAFTMWVTSIWTCRLGMQIRFPTHWHTVWNTRRCSSPSLPSCIPELAGSNYCAPHDSIRSAIFLGRFFCLYIHWWYPTLPIHASHSSWSLVLEKNYLYFQLYLSYTNQQITSIKIKIMLYFIIHGERIWLGITEGKLSMAMFHKGIHQSS